ncbi:hypothetical protein M407DRAFT_47299, partial [Tulasnella calospora MUT 4182]
GPTTVDQVVYKPNSQSTDEYIAIVNPDEYKKWLEGESYSLSGTFDIFHSGQGAQGLLGKASKQELAAAFDVSNETEALEILLNKGALQSGDKLKQFGDGNASRG